MLHPTEQIEDPDGIIERLNTICNVKEGHHILRKHCNFRVVASFKKHKGTSSINEHDHIMSIAMPFY